MNDIFEEYPTTSEIIKASIKMDKLISNLPVEEKKLEKAARIGFKIIKSFASTSFISQEAYKTCFGEMDKIDFYYHVISNARYCVKNYCTK